MLDEVSFAVPERRLLEPLTLTLPARRIVGLIGHNGSGKSTLLKILARQQPASAGRVSFEGRPLAEWGERAFARKLAYLPQHTPPASGMLVKELVALGRYPWHGALGRFGKVDRDKVEEAIELTDIAPSPTGWSTRCPAASASACGSPCWWRRTPNACCWTSRSRRSTSRTRSRCSRWCSG